MKTLALWKKTGESNGGHAYRTEIDIGGNRVGSTDCSARYTQCILREHLRCYTQSPRKACSNLEYSWVTWVILSNFCPFSSLCYLHTLCYFINFCHLIKLSLSYQTFVIFSSCLIYSHFTLSTHPTNVPELHTKQHNSLFRRVGRTSSAPIHLSNSTGVFGHRAILIKGDQSMAGGFLLEQTHTL